MYYDMDPVQWMTKELDSDKMESSFSSSFGSPRSANKRNASSSSSTSGMMTTPKKTPILERADTPVMSNSSKKNRSSMSRLNRFRSPSSSSSIQRSSSGDSGDRDHHRDDNPYEHGVPDPVRTPVRRLHTPNKNDAMMMRSTEALVSMKATPGGFYGQNVDKRYHDALHSYVKARRIVSDQLQLELDEQALAIGQSADATAASTADGECKAEVDFLFQLQSFAWGQSDPNPKLPVDEARLEGNAWMLLARLRVLGLAAVLWADDPISSAQHQMTETMFLKQVAAQRGITDKDLLAQLHTDKQDARPLVLRRRHEIMKWIQACFDPLCSAPPPKSLRHEDQQSMIPDEVAALIGETSPGDHRGLLESCLSHLFAGKMERAQQIARDHGQPWRASTFAGGQPHGIERVSTAEDETVKSVGNPHRFLWKRQMWKNGETSLGGERDESAICSFLANDVVTCFGNSALRTWEQCLAVVWNSAWGRMEDQVLHWNHNHRRERFPHLKQEQEQLLATKDLQDLSNSQIIDMLAASPYESMQGKDEYRSAMSAILIGKDALTEYIIAITKQCEDFHVELLRFLTHLALYLDSLSACSTPIILDQLEECKNTVLFEYVKYLASQPQLWNLLTLYASLLPDHVVLEFFPQLLAEVMENKRRKILLEQAREMFASSGMDLRLVRQVVRLLLSEEGPSQDDDDDNDASMMMNDVTKSRSIEWLLQYEEHYGDALICANMLLREFFMHRDDDKMESASIFVEQHLPNDLLEKAGEIVPDVDDGIPEESYHERIEYAKGEYLAFVSYLDAYASFGDWKDVLASNKVGDTTAASKKSKQINPERLTKMEAEIMRQMHVREWVKTVSEKGKNVIQAATKAQQALHDVLSLPGGWLNIDGEPIDTTEDQQREQQINSIRGRYIVLAVNFYLQVCQDTASWMSKTLDDAVPSKFATHQDALQALPSSFSPAHWYQVALDAAETIASDEYDIYKSFGQADLQEFLSKMAEISVLQAMVV
mmetsp:Transcript_18354/g.52428  ORF Transcript_18354/g.52428 Transcript_18354/m.52428 type:complete len:1000 (+) Transcript_18354:175-3174(+)